MGHAGEVGIGGIYQTTKRLRVFDYSVPLFTEHVRLYVLKANTFEFNTLADLNGKTLGALMGWSYGDSFDNAREAGLINVDAVNNDAANYLKLLSGRVDC